VYMHDVVPFNVFQAFFGGDRDTDRVRVGVIFILKFKVKCTCTCIDPSIARL
jgi:hypothetical protein